MNPSLFSLAKHAGSSPFFVAHHLARLREERGQTIQEQAEAFGLSLVDWSELALCRMPACALDLADIAEVVGVEPERLRELLQLDLWG